MSRSADAATGGRVLVLGAGDVGSAVAHALSLAGWHVALANVACPPVLRRGIAFADAFFDGEAALAGVVARRCDDIGRLIDRLEREPRRVAVTAAAPPFLAGLGWAAVVDARMRKHTGPAFLPAMDAPLVGLGPGFVAGRNCQLAVETSWTLPGAVVRDGATLEQAGDPRPLGGVSRERLVVSTEGGTFVT